MADVKFSGDAVVDLNGSVGDTTYARNAYGTYAKLRLGAPSPSTYRADWNTFIGGLSNHWTGALTDAQRATWYTRSQVSIDAMAVRNSITGFDLYMSVNTNLALIGLPALDECPIYQKPDYQRPFTLTFPSSVQFLVALPFPATVALVAVYMSAGLPAGRMSNNQIYTYLGVQSGGTTVNWFPDYSTRFPAFPGTCKVFCKVVPIDHASGVRGLPQYASAYYPF